MVLKCHLLECSASAQEQELGQLIDFVAPCQIETGHSPPRLAVSGKSCITVSLNAMCKSAKNVDADFDGGKCYLLSN